MDARDAPSTLNLRRRFALIVPIATVCLAGDQLTKSLAARYLADDGPRTFLNGFIRLEYTANPGGFLSMGSSLPEAERTLIFSFGVGVALLVTLLYLLSARNPRTGVVIGLSFSFGGGLSNLLDRLTMDGAVADFISVGFGTFRTGIFNVADTMIAAGIITVLVSTFVHLKHGQWAA